MRKVRCPKCHGDMLVVVSRACVPGGYSDVLCVDATCRRFWQSKADGVTAIPDGGYNDSYDGTPEGYRRYLREKKGIN